ncbi:MAG: hypothetical protein LBK98_09310 [Peptococcaceae bacterium]|jgi:ApbE superfamily uncharacterized protein (UPF0280 family)|nr:hypothetical protein [Peptococcaceae bacterium]
MRRQIINRDRLPADQAPPPGRVLEDGKVYIDYGPVSMVIMADKDGSPLTDLCCQAFDIVDEGLREITASLDLLRLYPGRIPSRFLTGLPAKMLEAVLAAEEPTLTPMAAVAGAMSDLVADWLFARGADRVSVNNGGDVALRLAPGQKLNLGVLSSLASGQVDLVVAIKAEDGVGGVATSGLGGRSFTRGIAQGVSVFSSRCVLADALATHLANTTYVPSPRVLTAKAGALDPQSDIRDLEIVAAVDRLTRREERQALAQVKQEAYRQMRKGNLLAMIARVQDQTIQVNMPAAK